MLYGNEACCLKERKDLKDGKLAKDFTMTIGLNETIDHSAIANVVHWYGHA